LSRLAVFVVKGGTIMSVGEGVTVALFCIMVVFAVLLSLYVVIKLFSYLVQTFEKLNKKPVA
jgi:Na+-transporting methylmalonyl-CoA/oxaloacetate decarboxylase gamma subunit